MIECTCEKFPDMTKGEEHHLRCPYYWLEQEQQ